MEGFNSDASTALSPNATQGRAIPVAGASLSTSGGIIDQSPNVTTGILQDWFAKLTIAGTTSSRYWIGLSDAGIYAASSVMNSDSPSANIVGFRFATDVDTNVQAVCQTSSSLQTVVDTGVAPTTSTPQVFEIVPGGGGVEFYIDDTLVATITTNVPADTVAMNSIVCLDGYGSGSTNFQFNFYYFYMQLAP
jgi:hypothetical protein